MRANFEFFHDLAVFDDEFLRKKFLNFVGIAILLADYPSV